MSVRFDAANDRITYSASNPPDPAGGFTMTGWLYLSVDTNDFGTWCRLHADTGASTTATFATSNDGTSGPNYFTVGGTITNATNFVVGEWRRWAVTCTGTSGKSYVATAAGATEVDSGTVDGADTPTGITVGGRSASDAGEPWNGRVAYLRVWSTVLNQTQIEAEWASTTPVVTSGLWADWPLLAHTDLTDHSGNGRDLVAGASSTTTEADPPVPNQVTGTGAATLGGVAAAATGVRTVLGSAAAALGALTGAATGTRATTGTGSASLGALTARATATTPGGTVTTQSGGWDTLAAIARENRQYMEDERSRVPVACPNDGEPLRGAPGGGVYCPWDGWRPGP